MLDAVDNKESLLVVAPTSAGKTFVSYYTMKGVLEANKRAGRVVGRAVMLLPTKSLVLQTLGDLFARYKEYQGAVRGSQVFAVWTRDFRDDGHEGAQILATLPELLLTRLLEPTSAGWVQSLRYVIVDEVHNICEIDRGPVYEQALALLPSPVICLSATVGSAGRLWRWLAGLQRGKGRDMAPLVETTHRWSDLRIQARAVCDWCHSLW